MKPPDKTSIPAQTWAARLLQACFGALTGLVLLLVHPDAFGNITPYSGPILLPYRLNNITTAYGYDNIGQLLTAQGFESNDTLRKNENLGYAYDASGNLAFRTNNDFLQSFNSDPVNQLQNITRAGPLTVAGSVTNAVTKLSVNSTNAEIYSDSTFATATGIALHNNNNMFVTAGSNAAGQLVVSTVTTSSLPVFVSFQYDLNGNLLNDGLKAYEYDDFNQLTAVSLPGQWRTEFVYDGLGRRRIARDYAWAGAGWARTNETRYICDGVNILQERDSNNVAQVTYTRGLDLSGTFGGAGGIGGLLARSEGGSHAYYHADIGGNVTSLTDSSGNLAARYLYDPYGNLLGKWGGALADANVMQFSSMPKHGKSGVSLYAFRGYDPNLQRWLNQDPIREGGGINLFEAFANEPLLALDYFGLDEHHYVTGPIRNDPDLSPEAARIFRNTTTGDVGEHDFSKPHPSYNKAVKDLWDKWIIGKNKSTLTDAQAKDFVNKVRKSKDPRIKDFLNDLEAKAKKIKAAKAKLNSRMCKLKIAAAATAALGAATALQSIAENPHYLEALKAASEGDEVGVDEAMYDLASDVAIETGDDRMLPEIFGVYYWTKKLKK